MEHKYTYSKIEIATYLRDFYRTMLFAGHNLETNFFAIFKHALRLDGRLQYANQDHYYHMIAVYEYMLISKLLTIYYDNYFDYLHENKINDIRIPKSMFINESDYNRFSKKQIIKFIRNAFNHNDNTNQDLIKFIRINENNNEVIKVEIYLKNTKPIPFHVVLDINTLMSIALELDCANTINLIRFLSTEPVTITSKTIYNSLEKLYIRKFFSKKKIDSSKLDELREYINQNGKINRLEDERLSNFGLEYKDIKFTTGQKVRIAEDLKFWENIGVSGNDVIFHLTNKVMPLSQLKARTLIMNICLVDYYMKPRNLSFQDMINEARKIYFNGICNDNSPLTLYTELYGINQNILYDFLDFDDIFSITDSIYYGYLFDTLITEKDIEVSDTKTIPREKIRNSFVHMRWFKGINECYKLFDWGNGIDDEFNSKSSTFWSCNIKVTDMLQCAEKYYKKIRSTHQSILDEPIHFRGQTLKTGTRIVDGISFIRDETFYFLSLTPNDVDNMYKLYVIDSEQVQRIATEEEGMLFISELTNLTDKEKNDYKELLEEIPSKIITMSEKDSNKKK